MPESQNLELKETLKISSLSFLIDITYHFHFHYVPSAAIYSELRIKQERHEKWEPVRLCDGLRLLIYFEADRVSLSGQCHYFQTTATISRPH